MFERERDLLGAHRRGVLSRRELGLRLGALGVGASTIAALWSASENRAVAHDFDWRAQAGEAIEIALFDHPYSRATIAQLDAFRALSGIEVVYDLFAEPAHRVRITDELASGRPKYDVLALEACSTWAFGPAGWLEDLAPLLEDRERTHPNYAYHDVLEGVRRACLVGPGGVAGERIRQWCVPWGYQHHTLTYNAAMLDRLGEAPPRDLDGAIELAAKARRELDLDYSIGVPGALSSATISAGFFSAYANFGERDLIVGPDGAMRAAMNTSGSRAFHERWIRLIREGGAADWGSLDARRLGGDLARGASMMIYDADLTGYMANRGDGAMAGQLAFAPFAADANAKGPTPNAAVFALAIPARSRRKEAAWRFLQWASGFEHGAIGASEMDLIDPVRASIWADDAFRDRIGSAHPGYVESHDVSAPGASIHFTPQPRYRQLTERWAAGLRRMVAGRIPIDEELDRLAEAVNRDLKEAGLAGA